ncbi:MAG: CPBP family intramembrane glutamic endopeptidase [Jatrophihabitans sp.]
MAKTGDVDEVVAQPVVAAPAPSRERPGLEVLAVLGVSFGMSGIYALLSLIRTEITVQGGVGAAQVTVATGGQSHYEWLDLLDSLADLLHGILPAFLAVVLLVRFPGGPGCGIGLDRLRERDVLRGVGLFLLIGIPGLALVYVAHRAGVNAQIVASNFPDVWYRIPVLLLDAFQNGAAEEIVVLAFVLTRLRQLGWSTERAIAAESVLRGSYHLYQGLGGFVGNAVMGAIFGYLFTRTRRVWPFVVAHFLLDAASFIGYIYLKPHVRWL